MSGDAGFTIIHEANGNPPPPVRRATAPAATRVPPQVPRVPPQVPRAPPQVPRPPVQGERLPNHRTHTQPLPNQGIHLSPRSHSPHSPRMIPHHPHPNMQMPQQQRPVMAPQPHQHQVPPMFRQERQEPPVKFSDIRKERLTPSDAREALSEYFIYRFEKADKGSGYDSDGQRRRSTWESVMRTEVRDVSKKEAARQVHQLNKESIPLSKKKATLSSAQQRQLERALEDLQLRDPHPHFFQTHLVQIDHQLRSTEKEKEKHRRSSRHHKEHRVHLRDRSVGRRSSRSKSKDKKKSVTEVSLTGYYKRSPKPEVDAIDLFNAREAQLRKDLQPPNPHFNAPLQGLPPQLHNSHLHGNVHANQTRLAAQHDGHQARPAGLPGRNGPGVSHGQVHDHNHGQAPRGVARVVEPLRRMSDNHHPPIPRRPSFQKARFSASSDESDFSDGPSETSDDMSAESPNSSFSSRRNSFDRPHPKREASTRFTSQNQNQHHQDNHHQQQHQQQHNQPHNPPILIRLSINTNNTSNSHAPRFLLFTDPTWAAVRVVRPGDLALLENEALERLDRMRLDEELLLLQDDARYVTAGRRIVRERDGERSPRRVDLWEEERMLREEERREHQRMAARRREDSSTSTTAAAADLSLLMTGNPFSPRPGLGRRRGGGQGPAVKTVHYADESGRAPPPPPPPRRRMSRVDDELLGGLAI
ncbi:hypothetical protein B0T17DRAFT_534105 [Bombardia bombarda]|uniref:Uncharacterized protein n=1 Tax=Bombardia bombarda TaxID=252184 RepID=A0AA39WTQ9_9PEZI|nr:hypothetical protein B0T17DRAFT_534105 [Bombardia bombarda]